MMGKFTFRNFPGAIGTLNPNDPREMIIHPESAFIRQQLKKYLTIENTSIQFRLKQIKQSLRALQQKYAYNMELTKTQAWAIEVCEKLSISMQALKDEADELDSTRFKELWSERDDGSLSVASGLWWLCERIEYDAHLNTEIPIRYINVPDKPLRPYQIEAIDSLMKYKRSTCELATGLGKSIIIYSMALSAVAAGKRVMIIPPTVALVEQIFFELKRYHKNVSAIGGDFTPEAGSDIYVSTPQSASGFIDRVDMVITDEAHHDSCDTIVNLFACAHKAQYWYNLSATCMRNDGLDMLIFALGGSIVYRRDVKWGIDNGYLVKPIVLLANIENVYNSRGEVIRLSKDIMRQSAYKTLYQSKIVMDVLLDLVNRARAKGRRPIVIFNTVVAAEVFQKYCKGKLDFRVAHAAKGKKSKIPLLQFQKGDVDILVACDKLISEGIDIPNSSALFVVTANSSNIITYQMIGRVLRLAQGKVDAVITDIRVKGYEGFEFAAAKREDIYRYITDDVRTLTYNG